jgi:type IV secretory pathway TraG/TraD family ATPase VirD4
LAKDCVYSTDCHTTGLNNNQIVVGGSGSGKTMSITEPCLLGTLHRNLIVTVTKPRVLKKYTPLLRGRGYRVEVVNFADPQASTFAFDPMRFIRNDRDITFLARSIVMANPKKDHSVKADPYWDEAAISLLCALIAGALVRNPGAGFWEALTLFRALEIRNGETIQTNYDGFFSDLQASARGKFAVSNWKCFCNLPPRTASCVVSSLGVTISQLFGEEVMRMLRMPRQLDLRELAREKSVLFVVSSPVNPGLNAFVSLFYATAMKELFEFAEEQEDGHLPITTHMVCDDFATGAPIPLFDQYISIIREKGLSVTILCQSESQLESMYGKAGAVTIINNCDSYVYTGGMDITTARNISQRLNQPVDEVLALALGMFAVFRRGEYPKVVPRYPILEDPLFQQITQVEKEHRQEIISCR